MKDPYTIYSEQLACLICKCNITHGTVIHHRCLVRIAGISLAVALGMFLVGVTETFTNNRQMHYSMRLTMHLKVLACTIQDDTKIVSIRNCLRTPSCHPY